MMPGMDDPTAVVRSLYRDREERFAEEQRLAERRSLWVSNLRALLFLGAAACAVVGLWGDLRAVWLGAAALLMAAFVAAVVHHADVDRRVSQARCLTRLQRDALSRLRRDFGSIPLPRTPGAEDTPPAADDLDLLGPRSLLHLLGTAHTFHGQVVLTRWILEPAEPHRIRERQRAVDELAGQLDERHEVAVKTAAIGGEDPEPFLTWAEGESWLRQRPWLVWSARLLAAVTIGLIVLDILDLIRPWLWTAPVAINLLLTRVLGARTRGTLAAASLGERAFRRYAELLVWVGDARWRSPLLTDLQRALATDRRSAVHALKRLDRLAGLADLRSSGMAHLPIQAVTLWDVHVLEALERWQHDAGHQVRSWMEAVGELEALCSLAALRHDHPHWCFPDLVEGGPAQLLATQVAHPLIEPRASVANDVAIGPPGTFLLVTGSNMSGKSTLLRAIGVNVVLAQAGAPVCAQSMQLPPMRLGTSFRVQDSLADGVSYFMAELQRLKEIVDLADGTDEQPVLLFLLDEILLGTNVVERQIAVQRVIGHLLRQPTIGAIATHDLTLAEVEACQPVHFIETFRDDGDRPRMTFDYLLRPGVSPTTNALKLLRMVGLTLEE